MDERDGAEYKSRYVVRLNEREFPKKEGGKDEKKKGALLTVLFCMGFICGQANRK